MLDSLLSVDSPFARGDWRFTILAIILSPFVLTYLVTSISAITSNRRKGTGKAPPSVPYAIPFLGNLISFAFDTCRFLDVNGKRFGQYVPVTFRVLNRKLHYISGPESTLSLFRNSRDLSTAPSTIIVLENLFGSPRSARHIYEYDNSGIHVEPAANSRPIKPQNRIYYGLHRTLHANLAGPGLADLAIRFMNNLIADIEGDSSIGFDEWVELDDLYSFLQTKIFNASTSALCGPHLLRLNPSFTADFWDFDSRAPGLFKSMPRWMIPESFNIRDKLHASVKEWHMYANKNFDWSTKDLPDSQWDELFGSKVMRDRQQCFRAIEGFGDDAIAATDLGMIWATNANVVPLIGFTMLDILNRPTLLSRVRDEIDSAFDPSNTGSLSIDMPKVLSKPLMQSIYSEELRLRNAVMIQRTTLIPDFQIGEWRFPKGQMIVASSWHEARDRNVWNEGRTGEEFHSVEEFWADRFLVYPNDPTSGPGKLNSGPKKMRKTANAVKGEPQFTIDSVLGSFIPYGGGQKICPGRFYAKQETLGSVAVFLRAFEVELKGPEGQLPQPNMEFFPFGVVQPKGKFPALIRRRKV